MRTSYAAIRSYVTADGSEIRELMHPDHHGNQKQSLAEATLRPGQETLLHKHLRTEELYHITAGRGLMTLGEERFAVFAGDTVHISPRHASLHQQYRRRAVADPVLLRAGLLARGHGAAARRHGQPGGLGMRE